jgi:hypothetical protein
MEEDQQKFYGPVLGIPYVDVRQMKKTVSELIASLQEMDPDAYVLVASDGYAVPWNGTTEPQPVGARRYEVPTVVIGGTLLREDYPQQPLPDRAFFYTITEVRDSIGEMSSREAPASDVGEPSRRLRRE